MEMFLCYILMDQCYDSNVLCIVIEELHLFHKAISVTMVSVIM